MGQIQKRRARRIHPDVQAEIENLALKGFGASQINVKLHEHFGAKEPSKLPHLKTIQRVISDTVPRDSTAPWRLADAVAEDAALVLPVLAAVIEESEGRVANLTIGQARWIAKLRHVAPDLALWTVYVLANTYMRCEEWNMPTADLDAYLALTPWRDDACRQRYAAVLPKIPADQRGRLAIAGELGIEVKITKVAKKEDAPKRTARKGRKEETHGTRTRKAKGQGVVLRPASTRRERKA